MKIRYPILGLEILPPKDSKFYHPRSPDFTNKSHMILPDFLTTTLALDKFLINWGIEFSVLDNFLLRKICFFSRQRASKRNVT
jgi:hypothetical protein